MAPGAALSTESDFNSTLDAFLNLLDNGQASDSTVPPAGEDAESENENVAPKPAANGTSQPGASTNRSEASASGTQSRTPTPTFDFGIDVDIDQEFPKPKVRQQRVIEDEHITSEMDPISRLKKAEKAKKAFLAGVLLLFFALPFICGLFLPPARPDVGDTPIGKALWYMVLVATSLPGGLMALAIARQWRSVMRPWLTVLDFARDAVYLTLIYVVADVVLLFLLKAVGWPQDVVGQRDGLAQLKFYLAWRFPVHVLCLGLALVLIIRWRGGNREWTSAHFQAVFSAAILLPLIGAFRVYFFPEVTDQLYALCRSLALPGTVILVAACVFALVSAFGIYMQALAIERSIAEKWLEGRERMEMLPAADRIPIGGLSFADRPLEMVVAQIGDHHSGKTTLLAGAAKTWSKKKWRGSHAVVITSPTSSGRLRDPDRGAAEWSAIRENRQRQLLGRSADRGGSDSSARGSVFSALPEREMNDMYTAFLEIIEKLYGAVGGERFPDKSRAISNLAFDYDLQQKVNKLRHVCLRLHTLDYPGGIFGNDKNNEQFAPMRSKFNQWSKYADGITVVIDISRLRRNEGARIDADLKEAFEQLNKSMADRNRNQRVTPVAFVMTKCDEIFLKNSRVVDGEYMDRLLDKSGYARLMEESSDEIEGQGGQALFRLFCTTAVTESSLNAATNEYEVSADGTLMPLGCAAPFYWIAGQCLKRNITLLHDLKNWFRGTTPGAQSSIIAAELLREMAEDDCLKVRGSRYASMLAGGQ